MWIRVLDVMAIDTEELVLPRLSSTSVLSNDIYLFNTLGQLEALRSLSHKGVHSWAVPIIVLGLLSYFTKYILFQRNFP